MMNDKTFGDTHIKGVSDSNITIQQAGRNIIVNGVAVDTYNTLLEKFTIADQVLQRIARDCATQKLNETQRLLLIQREVEVYLTYAQQIKELFANLPESIKAQPIIQELHTDLTQATNDGNYQQLPDIMERVIELLTRSSLRELHPDFWYVLYRLHVTRANFFDYKGYYEKSAWEWHKASEVLPVPPYKNDLTRSETRVFRELYTNCLHGAGVASLRAGYYAEAQKCLAPALQWREKLYASNPTHLDIAQSLNSLAVLYQAQGDYAQALPLLQRALAICEKVLGAEHPNTATSLHNLALLYKYQGDYAQALPLSQRALAIREKVSGAEHPDTATSLNNIALLYQDQGDYAQALPLLQRALAIHEKISGAEHPDTARSLHNLASLHTGQGDYAQALPLSQRALAIREKVLGAEHPETATSLNSFALLYVYQGDYAQALPLWKRALAIREKVLGAKHPETATSLNNLAMLYKAQSDYAQALPLLQRALAIGEKVLGAEHPDTAQSLNNLAALYQDQGDYAQALPLLQRALAIREKVLGAKHPDTATSLNNLALLYTEQGDYAQALPLLQRAVEIAKKKLGEEHPHYKMSYQNYQTLLNKMQQPKTAPKPKAEPVIEEPEKPQTIIDKLKTWGSKWWK
jgi:tetratricopeptide (TPR) repeat protein